MSLRLELDPAALDALAEAVAARVAEILTAQGAPAHPDEPYTVPEVAALLRVCPRTVRAMLSDGRLPRVPGLAKPLIPRAAITAIASGRQP
jgi:excisionase family DNA binding protein